MTKCIAIFAASLAVLGLIVGCSRSTSAVQPEASPIETTATLSAPIVADPSTTLASDPPTSTALTAPPDPTVQVDLPTDDSHRVVVHLPPALPPDLFHQMSSLLGQLSPTGSAQSPPPDSEPNWAEKWTGLGTVALAIIALITAMVAYFQFVQERAAREYERSEQEKARRHEQELLDEARTARLAEAFTAASQRWNDVPMRRARRTIRTAHDRGGAEQVRDDMEVLRIQRDPQYFALLMVMDYFEDLAISLNYNSISFDMVDSSLGTEVCQYWTIFEPFVSAMRKTPRDPDYDPVYYAAWEALAYKIVANHSNYSIPWKF